MPLQVYQTHQEFCTYHQLIKVINMSLGANILYPTAYCAAVQDVVDQSITVVVAAGKSDTYFGVNSSQASCWTISVGATNSEVFLIILNKMIL